MPKTSQLSLSDIGFRGRRSVSLEDLYTPEPNTGCWLFLGYVDPKLGYGQLRAWKHGRLVTQPAHRVFYKAMVGPLGDEDIDHLCRVRCCVNPAHLEAVSHRENTRRGHGPVGVNAKKTHCIRGHEFTPENTYRHPGGQGNHRQCRACVALRQQVAS